MLTHDVPFHVSVCLLSFKTSPPFPILTSRKKKQTKERLNHLLLYGCHSANLILHCNIWFFNFKSYTVHFFKHNNLFSSNAMNWPKELIMQLIPQSLLNSTQLQPLFKNSRQVAFHFGSQNLDDLRNLYKVMGTGFVSMLHYSSILKIILAHLS